MGKRSVKENKNIYHIVREELGFSRDEAAEKYLCGISAARLERIENERMLPSPEDVMIMAKGYKNPGLCNYYCSHQCPIGVESVPAIEFKGLPQITLEMVVTLNKLAKEKDRLMEITVDGEITDSEAGDFLAIQKNLEEMSAAIDALKLWVDQAIATGKVSEALFSE